MKAITKRMMQFRFDRIEDMAVKLEKMAAKGLLLEECGALLWTFRRGAPQKLRYSVTYFSEASMFDPDINDNQQTYMEYARTAGWTFVAQLNHMHIFCSEVDHPIPFETDENEKLNTIKKCMNKSFVPSMLLGILALVLLMFVQFRSFQLNPIDYLSDPIRLLLSSMAAVATLYHVFSLAAYVFWLKRSEKSIALGGGCVKNSKVIHTAVDSILLAFLFGSLAIVLLHLAVKTSRLVFILTVAKLPILMLVFWSSIKYLKKKKVSAMVNRLVSYAVLMLVNVALFALIMTSIMRFGLGMHHESSYRTVNWQLTETESLAYRLYRDDIPLTSEDLYGQKDYMYYSYEKRTDKTFLLSKSVYSQDSPPAKDSPPWIQYEVLETRFNAIYQLAKDYLLQIPEWQDNMTLEAMDNTIFGTIEAYQGIMKTLQQENILCFLRIESLNSICKNH